MATVINYRLLLRGGPDTEWTQYDPVLAAREPGINTTTGGMKIGDGTRTWSQLDYVFGGEDYDMRIGTVTTSADGTSTATITGDAPHQFLNLSLARGPQGVQGLQGTQGTPGPAPTFTVSGVTTGLPGSNAAVNIGGTTPNLTLGFTLPRGDPGATGTQGEQGPQGIPGERGVPGADGPANTLTIGTVTLVEAGNPANAQITGTAPNQTLSLTIPKGDTGPQGIQGVQGVQGVEGPANTLTVGTVVTVDTGVPARADITGTAPNQTLDLTIPRGLTGEKGTTGDPGPIGQTGPPGPEGHGLEITGVYATLAALPTTGLTAGDAHLVEDTNLVHFWDGTAWGPGHELQGAIGPDGPPNVLSISGVTTGAPGSNAAASITGTSPTQALALTIPRGDKGENGPPNTLTVGTLTTGAPGTDADVSITGTAPTQALHFTIPKGDTGQKGDKGDTGDTGPANILTIGTVTTGTPGDGAAANITGATPAQTLNLTIPQGIKGDTGDTGPANTLTIGTVTAGATGDPANAEITGTAPNQVLNLTLPRGGTGTSLNILGTVPTSTDLPAAGETTEPTTTTTQNYSEDTSLIANPERGWYQYTETHWQDATGTGHTPLDASALTTRRTGTETINGYAVPPRAVVFRYFIMEHMREVDALPQAFLDAVAADLAAARTAGVKLIARFTYSVDGTTGSSTDGPGPYNTDTTPARTLGHIAQLKPVIAANTDVIHAIQAGFVGTWGEWYYTDHWGNKGTLTQADWDNRAQLITALLDWGVDYTLLRYVGLKRRYVREGAGNGWAAPTDASERLGFHNDAFQASEDNSDWGTFNTFADGMTITEARAYLAVETARPVPMVGETAGVSTRSTYPATSTSLAEHHWSALNPNYHPDVLASWTSADKDEASRKLGYRLRLTSATLPTTGGYGGAANITLHITNDGWGHPLVARPIRIVFVSGGTTYTRTLARDIRTLGPGSHTISESVGLPTAAGTYGIHLAIPDPSGSLAIDDAYSIQLANTTGWVDGRNDLGAAVTVSSAVGTLEPGDSYTSDDTGHLWFWNGTSWIDSGKIRGDKGETGATGPANVLTVGTVTTGLPGSTATADITGITPSQALHLTIPRGDKGEPGLNGADGPANVLTIGTVSTLSAGSPADARITGTSPTQVLNLDIPRGQTGPPNNLDVGTVTKGAPTDPATATITGTAPNQILNLTLPQGVKGDKGDKGDTGQNGPANTLTIGSVIQGNANATITGTAPDQTLNLVIPKGDPGTTTWDGLTGKPTTFTPSSHNHAATEITTGTLAAARLPNATATVKGAMSPAHYSILDGAASNAVANGLIRRDADAMFTISTPTSGFHPANRNYVDAFFTNRPEVLVLGPTDPVPTGTPEGTLIARTA